jgi:hypothetical protein
VTEPIIVTFEGPFGWFADREASVFGSAAGRKPGIYLWTVLTQGHGELVYYVGETGREFRLRFAEHLKEQLSGWYRLNDPQAMQTGSRVAIWPGLYGASAQKTVAPFVEQLSTMAPALRAFVHMVRFHLATYEGDARMRKRIEAAIAQHLYRQPEPVGSFQEADIHYDPRLPQEAAVEVIVRSGVPIQGLPEVVAA